MQVGSTFSIKNAKFYHCFFMHEKFGERRERGNQRGEGESILTNHEMAARHENRKTFPNRKHIKQQVYVLICHPFPLPSSYFTLFFVLIILLRNFVHKVVSKSNLWLAKRERENLARRGKAGVLAY